MGRPRYLNQSHRVSRRRTGCLSLIAQRSLNFSVDNLNAHGFQYLHRTESVQYGGGDLGRDRKQINSLKFQK